MTLSPTELTPEANMKPELSSDEALVECPKCERTGEDCGEHAPTWEQLTAYWKAKAEDLTRELAKAKADAEMLAADMMREVFIEGAEWQKRGRQGRFSDAVSASIAGILASYREKN